MESRVPLLQCRKWEAQDYKEEDEESPAGLVECDLSAVCRSTYAYRCFPSEGIVFLHFFSNTPGLTASPSVATRALWGSRLPYDVLTLHGPLTALRGSDREGRKREKARVRASDGHLCRLQPVCPRRRPEETGLYRCEPINRTRLSAHAVCVRRERTQQGSFPFIISEKAMCPPVPAGV